MSYLLTAARLQKRTFKHVVTLQKVLENGLHTARFRLSMPRKIARHLKMALELEHEMYSKIQARDFDIEEEIDLHLMRAVSRLTLARINRLAYAGRVLP